MENKNLANYMNTIEYTHIEMSIDTRMNELTKNYKEAIAFELSDNARYWKKCMDTLEKARQALQCAWDDSFTTD